MSRAHAAQLGFDALLASAEQTNATRQVERECADLPGSMENAIPFYRALIERHHAAMLAADAASVMAMRAEAHRLAAKLNNFQPGIIADDDAPGCVLERETRAAQGAVPLWGQSGTFEVAVGTMRVRIEMDGMFGISASQMPWLGFSAHAVELDRPFLSETGYRSFIGLSGELAPGHTPDTFAAAVIGTHVRRVLKGRLLVLEPRYRHSGDKDEAKP